MRMEIGLSQVQVQKQILSPQMIQSMEILVLNSQQLEERIDQALEENVALELTEPNGDGDEGTDADGAGGDSGGGLTDERRVVGAEERRSEISDSVDVDALQDRYEHLAEFQADEYYYSPGRFSPNRDDDGDKHEALLNAAGRSGSLQEDLEEQIRLRSDLDDRRRQLCLEIVYNLDSRGYLMYPIEEIHESLNRPSPLLEDDRSPVGSAADNGVAGFGPPVDLPVPIEEITECLDVVRSLDPPGVCARDLKECLLLQLDRDPGDYPLERELITNHLTDIARNRLPQIAKATGKSLEAVKDAIEIITSLNPIPGRAFEVEHNVPVKPDVIIEEHNGSFEVKVENGHLPKVRISPYYQKLLAEARKDPEIRKYIKKKIDNAEWLLHAIHQRSSTLQRVAEHVVEHQQDFFRNGPRHLRPLKMQEIADKIGVNVSTVSRAIAGKYFQAPGSIKELKYLFTGGTQRDDGSMESRSSVILRIKELVADENSQKPLSDSKIVTLLAKEGIHISRRTVTKYREAEGVPSSRERRVF